MNTSREGGATAPTVPLRVPPTPRTLRRIAWQEAIDLLTHDSLEEDIVGDLAFELTGDLHARLPPDVVRDYADARAGVVRTIERLYLRTTPNNPRKSKQG